jgi:hypothetical protein
MFIFWGSRHIDKKIGYVADFCVVCRELRSFRLSRLGLASHLYGISVTNGRLIGYYIECVHCKTRQPTELERYREPIIKSIKFSELKTPETFVYLTKSTFPTIAEFHKRRLVLEADIKNNTHLATPAERAMLLREPFEVLDVAARTKLLNTSLDLQFVGWIFAVVSLAFLLTWLVGDYEWQDEIFMVSFWIAVAVIACIFLFIQARFATSRMLKRDFFARIATTLYQLRPTKAELRYMLEKNQDLELASRISADQLHDLISEVKKH